MTADHFNETCFQILEHELIPAQGCTEPIAIAYAAAKARSVLGEMPVRMELRVSGNMVKNTMGVVVPNSNEMRGTDVAAILGALAGKEGLELEVLKSVTQADIDQMKSLLGQGFCKCILCEEEEPLYISALLFGEHHRAQVDIRHSHTNISYIAKDGQVLFEDKTPLEQDANMLSKQQLTLESIVRFATTADLNRLKALLAPQIQNNLAIGEEGLKNTYGAAIGQTVAKHEPDCARVRACAKAAAGSDARMGGCILPVVINSGSGNQGITVCVPVVEYAKELKVSEETLYRALAISNLFALHMKSYIGNLSAFCGAVSAACGAGVAITYMMGGDLQAMERTATNTLGNTSGIICDGAKSSCAAKIYSSLSAAILAAEMSMDNHVFQPGEGIVADDNETTIRNVGTVGKTGMRPTDSVVLNLMLARGRAE